MQRASRSAAPALACSLLACLLLGACGGGASTTTGADGVAVTPGQAPVAAFTLAGARVDTTLVGDAWIYAPTVSGAAGVALAYRLERAPDWMSVDPDTGDVSGAPLAEQVGRYSGIRLVASDGRAEAALSFDLEVVADATGSARVAWQRPSVRSDGTPLANLATYRVYYGRSPERLDRRIDVHDANASGAEIAGLTSGTWYFSATALDAAGYESEPSPVASKQIG